MKKLLAIFITAFLLVGCTVPVEQEVSYRQITMDEAVAIIKEESNYIILDVRTTAEYNEKHITGAINIPNETIATDAIPELPDKDLVYCRSGNRSKQASEKLAKLGYTNVVEFGGIIDWPGETETNEGGPL